MRDPSASGPRARVSASSAALSVDKTRKRDVQTGGSRGALSRGALERRRRWHFTFFLGGAGGSPSSYKLTAGVKSPIRIKYCIFSHGGHGNSLGLHSVYTFLLQ